MTVHTCTKVNIGLHVLRRRSDGYHDLETLFVPCHSFSDTLEVETAEHLSIDIQRDGGVDWDPMEDLTVKAWKLLKADFPKLSPVSIRLLKQAPVGAGLGGGSADAAAMLHCLNELGSLGLREEQLALYAARLGSDCAFFIYGRPMFGSGRGEVLEPFELPQLQTCRLRVELPLRPDGRPVAVSTREAYSGILPRDKWKAGAGAPLRELLQQPLQHWRGSIVNDFEATVCPAHPEISALIERMYSYGAVYAAMSGSGSAVFGLFQE